MRSQKMTFGLEKAPHRSLLYALGLTREEMKRPLIGVVNAANEVAVARFLAGDIGFTDIPALVKDALDNASDRQDFCLGDGDVATQAFRAVERVERTDRDVRRRAALWRP